MDNKVFTRKCGEKMSASFAGLGAPKISETHCEPQLKPTQVYHKWALVRAKHYSCVFVVRIGNLPPFLL